MTFPAFTQGEKRTLFFYDQSKLIEVLRENKQQTRGSLSLCIHRFANKCLPPLDSKHSQRSTVEKPKTQRPPELTSVELFMAELSKGMQTLRFVQLEMNVTNWSSSEYDALGRLVAQSTYKKQAPLCYLRYLMRRRVLETYSRLILVVAKSSACVDLMKLTLLPSATVDRG